ncbi:MAG: EscS/YscS/HrcS family type III secretion system export apparatus protein [Janthinobacterium lividum]
MLTDELSTSLLLFATMAGPPLAVALVVGLIVGLLQAATQIQDQTLPLTFKVTAVCATLVIMAPTLFPPLLAETQRLFDQFPAMTRH